MSNDVRLRKGLEVELDIERMEFPNKGIAHYEGHKIAVKNAFTGQKVLARLTRFRATYVEAKILEVICRAEFEEDSFCEHFGKCGGCSFQTVPYEKQIEIKEGMVKSIIDSAIESYNENCDGFFDKCNYDLANYKLLPVVKNPSIFEYRNKMEFSFGDSEIGGPLKLGMHKKGSFYEIVNVDKCHIVDEDYRILLREVLKYFTEKEVPYYHKKSMVGILRYLVVRKSVKTNQILINLFTTSQTFEDESVKRTFDEDFVKFCHNLGLDAEIKGIIHSYTDSQSDVALAERFDAIYGEDKIVEKLFDLKFNISTKSFFQTNTLGAESLYSVIRDFVGETKDKVIYDLYSGTGTIGQIVSANAKKVIGIEIVEDAVKKANENAKLNGIENCTFIAGDVLNKVHELVEYDGGNKPDIIILDPPRQGIHPKALPKILEYSPEEFIYVSCKPSSLSKDLPLFFAKGYKLSEVRCCDLFTWTSGIETVLKLVK